jgi:hypothetical protein
LGATNANGLITVRSFTSALAPRWTSSLQTRAGAIGDIVVTNAGQIAATSNVTLIGTSTLTLVGTNTLQSLNFNNVGGLNVPTANVGTLLNIGGGTINAIGDSPGSTSLITGGTLNFGTSAPVPNVTTNLANKVTADLAIASVIALGGRNSE